MVRRFRAFLASIVWTALGLAVGIVALALASRGLGDDGVVAAVRAAWRDAQFWWLVLTPPCVIVGGLWIATVGVRNARSTAALAVQGALIGWITALLALLLFLIVHQLRGGPTG